MATAKQRAFTGTESRTGFICKVLLHHKEDLKPWEVRFVRTLWGNTHMSERQAETLMGIWKAWLDGIKDVAERYPWRVREMAERMAAERAESGASKVQTRA